MTLSRYPTMQQLITSTTNSTPCNMLCNMACVIPLSFACLHPTLHDRDPPSPIYTYQLNQPKQSWATLTNLTNPNQCYPNLYYWQQGVYENMAILRYWRTKTHLMFWNVDEYLVYSPTYTPASFRAMVLTHAGTAMIIHTTMYIQCSMTPLTSDP